MLGSFEPDRLGSRVIPGVAALLLLFSIVTPAQQPIQPGQPGQWRLSVPRAVASGSPAAQQSSQPDQSRLIRIITQDDANNPIPEVTVQIKRDKEVVGEAVTDVKGEAAVANLAPGRYEIVVSKEGFETRAQQDVTLAAAAVVEV